MIRYILPISVTIPHKRVPDGKVMLNMNNYRNMHHQVSNQAKQLFEPISGQGFSANRIRISYHVEKTTRRKFDTMNIVSIVDKFFLDWLVNNGRLLDDTCENVQYGSITGVNGCEESRAIAWIEVIE